VKIQGWHGQKEKQAKARFSVAMKNADGCENARELNQSRIITQNPTLTFFPTRTAIVIPAKKCHFRPDRGRESSLISFIANGGSAILRFSLSVLRSYCHPTHPKQQHRRHRPILSKL
jgi:hypothetical protein